MLQLLELAYANTLIVISCYLKDSLILSLVGVNSDQLLDDQVKFLNLRRTFTFTLLGLVLVGPTLHFW